MALSLIAGYASSDDEEEVVDKRSPSPSAAKSPRSPKSPRVSGPSPPRSPTQSPIVTGPLPKIGSGWPDPRPQATPFSSLPKPSSGPSSASSSLFGSLPRPKVVPASQKASSTPAISTLPRPTPSQPAQKSPAENPQQATGPVKKSLSSLLPKPKSSSNSSSSSSSAASKYLKPEASSSSSSSSSDSFIPVLPVPPTAQPRPNLLSGSPSADSDNLTAFIPSLPSPTHSSANPTPLPVPSSDVSSPSSLPTTSPNVPTASVSPYGGQTQQYGYAGQSQAWTNQQQPADPWAAPAQSRRSDDAFNQSAGTQDTFESGMVQDLLRNAKVLDVDQTALTDANWRPAYEFKEDRQEQFVKAKFYNRQGGQVVETSKPTKMHKRKNQINSLVMQHKLAEVELTNARAEGRVKQRRLASSKYGW